MIVTLIGKDMAREGEVFQYIGPVMECRDCKIKNVCFNLEEGRWYRVTRVREQENECGLHLSGKVVAVEVEPVPVPVLLPKKSAIEGATVTYHPVNCDDPELQELCRPYGLKPDTKVTIESIGDEVTVGGEEYVIAYVKW